MGQKMGELDQLWQEAEQLKNQIRVCRVCCLVSCGVELRAGVTCFRTGGYRVVVLRVNLGLTWPSEHQL